MAGPYDYTIQQPDISGSIAGGIKQGLEIGAAFNEVDAQKEALEKHKQYSADLQSYLQAPSSRGASALQAKYPEVQKAIGASFETYNKGQKEDLFKAGTQAYSAIQSGRPDIAAGILDERIKAAENSGEDTADLMSLKQSLERDPGATGAGLALTMSALNPEGWSKIAGESREAALAPSKLTESQSKATKAGVDAKYAESNAAKDLEKKGWDIWKIGQDAGISKLNSQIAAMNAETSRQGNAIKQEGNNLKQQELQLKIQDKITKRDDAVRAKAEKIESVRGTIDNSLSTIDRILKNPALDAVLGSVEGSSLYPTTLVGLLPGTASADDRANAIADIDTLKSQTFLNQLQAMKEASTTGASGLGGLTEKEGEKLVNGVQSLGMKQGEKQYKQNLAEVQRLLLKNRESLARKYGVPDTIPDRPNLESQPPSSGFKVLGVE